ncbi:hypothetical protein ACN077_16345 [Clostridium chromiireducens]|uniref:hypothetical protein n=1 Tax=Clostridium chromiireducens TaxID=225345 RepID=UPI003AF8882B
MPNIFDGLKKISDKDIIQQIALLENMNISNVSKPIIQKAKKKTISIINFIGSKIGRNTIIEEPEVKDIWALIDERKEELSSLTREELDERLLNIILEKSKSDMKNPTEDEISIEVIEEAAKLYKMYNDSTPSQKADIIYSKYNDKINGKAKEYINEQPFVDLQETTEDIEEIINNMDEKQRKEFAQSVDVENLTLLNVWKKLDRLHFSRLIWLCVKAYGGRFTPKEEILPSYIDIDKDVEIVRGDEELKKSQEELLELKSKIDLCKDKINSIEKNLQKENRILNNAIKGKSQAEGEIIDLEKMSAKLEPAKKAHEDALEDIKLKMEKVVLEELDLLMEEYKKIKFSAIDINNKISDTNIEVAYKKELIEDNTKLITTKEKLITETASEFQQLKGIVDDLIKEYDLKKTEVIKREDIKRSEIFERWSNYFDNFTFEFKRLNNVVNFNRKDLLHIEECLYELHTIKDPMALSMGTVESTTDKKEEYQYMDAIFPDKFQVEIQYKVTNDQEKKVHIVIITTKF